jgi:hypothetical protein
MGYLLQARQVATVPGLTDQNSGSYRHVATMFPACPRGWRWVGQRGYPGYGQRLPRSELVFRTHPDAVGDPLADVVSWSYVWGIAKGWAMWRAVPPRGFVVLGDVFHYNYRPDHEETFTTFACVREDCVRAVPVGAELWNGYGTGASNDASMWIVPDGTGNPWQRFRVQPRYDPPDYPVYVLNMDVVEVVGEM